MNNSQYIINFFNRKYGEPLGIIVLIKCLSAVSTRVRNIFPLNILCITFSQSWKTRSSKESKIIFPKIIEEFGSDFTIHSLMKKYKNGKEMFNRVGSINDMTVLFLSKQSRTQSRLIGAFAESLSDGKYEYHDFKEDLEWSPIRWGLISNITLEKYESLKDFFISSTLEERMLKIQYSINKDVWKKFNREKETRFDMKFKNKIRIGKPSFVKILNSDKEKIEYYAEELQVNSMSSSLGKTHDKIESILCANAKLNGRNSINNDDYKMLDIIMQFTRTEDKEAKIYHIMKKLEEKNIKTTEIINYILNKLGYSKNSGDYIWRLRRKFKLRGLI